MKLPASLMDASLLRKLQYIATFATLAGMLFAMLLLAVMQWVLQRSELEKSVYAQAAIVAVNSASALVFGDREAAQQTLAALASIDNIEYAQLFDKAGNDLAVYSRSGAQMPTHHHSPWAVGIPHAAEKIEVVIPVVFKQETIGFIHVHSNLKPLYAKLAWSMLLMFAASLGALLVAMFLLLRLLPSITAPLSALVGLTDAVSRKKNYSLRSPLQGKDELGTLARGFNNMLENIQQRDEELARHREHLEEEVAIRTASLAEAQRITLQIIETIPMRVFWKDRELRYLGCNTLFAKDAGLNYPAELTDKNDFDMGWRDQADLYRTDDRLVMDTNRPKLSYDEPQTTPDGGRIWLRTSKVPLHNEANEAIGILGVYEDITTYKQMELRLLESEERFRKAFQYSAIGMALVGLDGRWLKVNDSLCQIVGYSEQELLNKTFQDITHPDDLQTDLGFVAQLLSGEKDHYQMEKRYLHKDGHVVWIRLSVSLIRDAQNTPIHLVAQIDDITEDKLAKEEIRQLNEELETKVQERTQQLLDAQEELVRKEKLAVLGQVAGSVGHELRNPLGVMSNAVYFLQAVLPDADDSVKEYLNIIKSEIASSERIVSDLLDSVRTKQPHAEVVGVREVLEQTLRKLSIPSSVTVKQDIPATLSPLRVDALQIHQVLRNLISNGVEAMPEGGTLDIRAVEDVPAKTISISVRDSGIGMTPEQLGKLFQPLFTTKARGIGLGLVVVKNLTQANGGTVKVESETGKGATFFVTLPCDSSTIESV